MAEGRSPWLALYARSRPVLRLEGERRADVCVIGGGIAGITTLYQGLKTTKKAFVLLEADKVGHGATGHNAGQAVDRFERPLSSLTSEFGVSAVGSLQAEVTAAWPVLEELCAYAGVELVQVRGRTAITEGWHLGRLLDDREVMRAAGLEGDDIILAEDSRLLSSAQDGSVRLVPRQQIDALRLRKPGDCEGVAFSRRGCVNSSLLAERLLERLLAEFPGRLHVHESSAVTAIAFGEEVVVRSAGGQVPCAHAVLCTNGYDASPIDASEGLRYTSLQGLVACMLGYFDPQREAPAVLTYLPPREGYYYYITRRATDQGDLVCVGGPERKLKEGERFKHHADLVPGGREEIHRFLRDAIPGYVHREEHPFFWTGLMGYTSSGLRLVGPHPEEARLLLNLGCNGIGILPSVAAAGRIAAHLRGEDPPPSLFEPARQPQ